LGISGRCEKRYGVDPIFSEIKSEMVTRNWQQVKNGNKKLAAKMATINSTQKETNTIE